MNIDNILNSVQTNTTERFTCPFCGGYNTFTVTNTGISYIYNCFKNSCKIKGVNKYVPNTETIKNTLNNVKTIKKQPFTLAKHIRKGIVNEKCTNYLTKYNQLEAYNRGLFSIGYDSIEDRLIYFLECSNEVVGAIGRTLANKQPKAIIYPNSATVPFIVGKGRLNGVIVEDCASAAVIASNEEYTGIALLGTILKAEYLPYLLEFNKIYLALDNDARIKALKLYALLKMLHGNIVLWNIPKDIKNMTKEELTVFIKENK